MTRKKKAFSALGAVVALLSAYLLLWPVPIDPAAWSPPEAPALEGPYAVNSELASVEHFPLGGGIGAEDVAIDARGQIYGGLIDGRIVRLNADGTGLSTIANTGGRPLGLHFDSSGKLIIADATRGLLSMDPEGTVVMLADEEGGRPFRLTDDVDIGADGTIYFSDASDKFSFDRVIDDLLEHRPNGRLLAYDPGTKDVELLVDQSYFANGVAVSRSQDFVLFTETGKYRVRKHWLAGPKKGETEVLIDNLPGFPDGISAGADGIFWVAIVSPRDPMVDFMLPRPWLRKVVRRLPEFVRPGPKRHAFVLGIDKDGTVVANLQDTSSDSYSPLSSVEEHGDYLYLGSLERETIARYKRK